MSDSLELISAFLDGDLTTDEAVELETWILAEPEHSVTFARHMMLHSHVRDALAGEMSLRLSQLRSPALFEPIQGSLDDAIIMRALPDSEVASELPPTDLAPGVLPADEPVVRRWRSPRIRVLRVITAAAAIIVLCVGIALWRISAANVVKLTAGVDSAWEPGQPAHVPGDSLSAGDTLRLAHGFVELKYPSGAKIVLQGPAECVLNSRQELTLLHGRLTAQIPVPAHGFTVATPAGRIVDLGTEFGVDVVSDKVVETQVFVGRISLQSNGNLSRPPLIVAAGQSAHLTDAAAVLAPFPAPAEPFVRDIHQIGVPFLTHSTGTGLEEGDLDPNWQLTSVANNPQWQPKPAEVSHTLGFYARNDDRSSWVSISSELPEVDPGLYTFATTFDLTGFDPRTARLYLSLSADDDIPEIRLNGQVATLKKIRESVWYHSMHPVTLDAGFVAGVNHLEIIVHNAQQEMALRAELHGTAARDPDEPRP